MPIMQMPAALGIGAEREDEMPELPQDILVDEQDVHTRSATAEGHGIVMHCGTAAASRHPGALALRSAGDQAANRFQRHLGPKSGSNTGCCANPERAAY